MESKDKSILILSVFIIIVSIGIVLLTPFLSFSSGYGEFQENIGSCVSGIQYFDKVCIPNSKTGKGCLLNGRITYNTYRTQQKCENYPIRSEWGPPEYGECISGKQIITRECLGKSEATALSGVNNCFVETSTGTIYYSIGDYYTENIECIDKKLKGEWVLLSPEYKDLPKDKLILRGSIPFVQNLEDIYEISKFCNPKKVLEIGTYNNILACEYGDDLYISSTKKNKYCSGKSPKTLVDCRYLPENYPYYLLSLDNRWVVVEHLPGNFGGGIPFVNNVSPGNFEYPDVELVISDISKFNRCSLQNITRESGVGFIFISLGKNKYSIGLTIGGGYPGVLVLRNNRLFWRQSPIGPNSPGTDMGDIFEVKIEELNSIESRIQFFTDIRIKDIDNNQLVSFELIVGRKYFIDDEIDSKDCSIYTL